MKYQGCLPWLPDDMELRLRIHDRRWAAIYAAGRIVVARDLGCKDTGGRVWPLLDYEFLDGPVADRRLWKGFVWHTAVSSPKHQHQLAVAGSVAAWAWRSRMHGTPALDLHRVLDGVLSRDIATGFTDVDPVERHVPAIKAAKIVWKALRPPDGRLWFALVRESRRLIVEGRGRVRETAERVAYEKLLAQHIQEVSDLIDEFHERGRRN